jgi:outer membrane immunogenic protein
MKAIVWTAAAVATAYLIGSAAAADAPNYAPAYVPAWAPRPAAFDWNGLYVGGHLGGAFQERDVTVLNAANGTQLGTGSPSEASFAGGGQLGVNFALWASWMVGMEADLSGTFLHNSATVTTAGGAAQVQTDSKTDMYGTARFRTGYIWNNWLFYGTAGFGWSDAIVTRTQLTGITGGAGPGIVEKVTGTPTGWVAGGGIEWAFAPKWTARLEYLHLDLGPNTFMFPTSGIRRDVESNIDVVRLGLNYRFNLLTLAP